MPLIKKIVDTVGQAKVLQHFQLAFKLSLIAIEWGWQGQNDIFGDESNVKDCLHHGSSCHLV